ncbi:MAG: hypothetical protein PHQ12_04735 [Chthoniobacteraceae bacterium]|nr:hypothetical protein [Chthoniobacteraceae bacterium]
MKLFSLFTAAILATVVAPAFAGDLAYPTLVPQTADTELVIAHKSVLAQAPRRSINITTTGTTSVPAAMFDRLIVNTAGTASSVVLTDGTTAIASATTTAQTWLPFGIVLSSGTLTAVTTGTANITITFR